MTSTEKLFDVFVQIKEGLKLHDIERLSYEVHTIPREQMDMILRAFRQTPRIKVGNSVSREKADKVHDQLSQVGLDVFIVPVLSLAPVVDSVADNTHLCEACNTRVVLPANRQCPHCGVFVDKLSPEALLKKKIRDNERLKLEMQAEQAFKASEKRNRQRLEDALRKQIREELEAEFGIEKEKSVFGGNFKFLKIAGVVLLFPIGFYGGFVFSKFNVDPSQAAVASNGQNSPMRGAGDTVSLESLGMEGFNAEDDLFHAGRPKGVSLGQALQAANTLGKSMGNAGAGAALRGGQASAEVDGTDNASGVVDSPANELKLLPQQRYVLLAELTRQLAEMRQFQRAEQALKKLGSLPSPTPAVDFSMSVPMIDLEVKALRWISLSSTQASKGLEALRADVMLMANPAERGWALGRMAVIASRHVMLPPAVAKDYLSAAEKSLASVVNVQERNKQISALKVMTGEVYLAEVGALVRSGQWSKVQAALQPFAQLLSSTTDPYALIRLHALDDQLKRMVGQAAVANTRLDAAFTLLRAVIDPAEQAVLLRDMLNLSQAFDQADFFKMAAEIRSRLLVEKNSNAHFGLMQLALLYKEADLMNDFEAVAQQVKDLAPSGTALNSAFYAETVLRGDLILAKKSHAAGQYYNAEAQLRRLADLLSGT